MDPAIFDDLIDRGFSGLGSRKEVASVMASAFPEQQAFISDAARLKTLFCTRRAAKSFTAGLYMVKTCLEFPGVNCLFIGLTRSTAEGIIIKDILKVIDRAHDIGIEFNKTSLECTFPNGSVIRVTGIDVSEDEMNKLLGKKYKLVCIDEGSLYTVNLRHLVYDILGPAMADQEGTICLFGTSSNFTQGLFFDITNGKEAGWSLHRWSAHENPHINWQKQLDDIKTNRPLYMETPQFRQWYLNEWVVETDKLVYKFNPQRNIYDTLPYPESKAWTYVLACDLGWEDDTGFVLSGYHANDPCLYIIKAWKKPHMTFDMVEAALKVFMDDKEYPVNSVIIDGANKQGVETMRMRSDIYFEYADKLGKVDHIEMLNGDLIQGQVKLHRGLTDLMDEMMALVWKTTGDKIVYPKKEHPSLPNHLCFIAGTMVETIVGPIPIEQIKCGELVRTRNGFRSVTASAETGTMEVATLTFSNGREIICTVDHPFYTKNRGWICAKDLNQSDKLFGIEELNSTDILEQREGRIESIILPTSSRAFVKAFTSMFTRWKSDLFQRDSTFTILMKTRTITTALTWKQLIQKNICKFMVQTCAAVVKKCYPILKRSGLLQRNGTDPKKAGNGTLLTPNRLNISRLYARPNTLQKSRMKDGVPVSMTKPEPANSVKSNLVQINTRSSDVAPALVRRRIDGKKERVYNLTVGIDHEYFAEGLLVSNCDAFLYNWFNGYHFLSSPAKKALTPGTPEYIKEQEDLHKQAIRERIQRESAEKDGVGQMNWHKDQFGRSPWNTWE